MDGIALKILTRLEAIAHEAGRACTNNTLEVRQRRVQAVVDSHVRAHVAGGRLPAGTRCEVYAIGARLHVRAVQL